MHTACLSCLAALIAATLPGTGAHAIDFELLGYLPGGNSLRGFGINQLGQVAGESEENNDDRGFLYTPGEGLRNIGAFTESDNVRALDLNDSAVVVGWLDSVALGRRAVRYTSGVGLEDLGNFGGFGAEAQCSAINSGGVIVGWGEGGDLGEVAFCYTDEKGMVPIGTPPGFTRSVAYDINDSGQIVGSTRTGPTSPSRAFRYTEGTFEIILVLDPSINIAFGINDLGHVVGFSGPHAFLDDDEPGVVSLPKLNPAGEAIAFAINNDGWVVGFSDTAEFDERAVVWTPEGRVVNLNHILPEPLGSEVELLYADDINESLQITGVADANGLDTAFVLTLCDDPDNCPGACCLPDGACMQMFEADCAASGGVFNLILPCLDVDCIGSCCLPSGACVLTGEADCAASGGDFDLEGTCDDGCFGACCISETVCILALEDSCTGLGGTWVAGATCSPGFCAGPPCVADIEGDDGVVDFTDLAVLLADWNTMCPCVGDLDDDDDVDFEDLSLLLGAWGPCP